jgi:hypothetical protein
MKKIITILFLYAGVINSNAQLKLDDFGRIVLNTYLSDKIAIPTEAKNLLITKLNQIASNNGIGGSQSNPRFIITANINVGTKDFIAGPPQMIAQNIDINLLVGDAITNTIFSNKIISLKGVGTNENKAFIDAFRNLNTKSKEVSAFLEEGKTKIIDYYSTNCDFIIKDAQSLVKQQKYAEAICQLTLVPEVCQSCYFKCLDTLSYVYQLQIDADCKVKYNQARVVWASAQNSVGAEKAGDILSSINPMANCHKDVTAFIKVIDAKLKADEKARWQFKMKQYVDKIAMQKEQIRIAEEKVKRDDDYRENQSQRDAVSQEKQFSRNFELDRIRINAYRQIALEQARNQPKSLTYNNIIWR